VGLARHQPGSAAGRSAGHHREERGREEHAAEAAEPGNGAHHGAHPGQGALSRTEKKLSMYNLNWFIFIGGNIL
jgi:hypothetical protein